MVPSTPHAARTLPALLTPPTQTTPSPSSLTLFLKSHRLTTLVFADADAPLTALKADLLTLLRENAANLALPLPDAPGDIVLGAMRDPAGADVAQGFYVLEKQGAGDGYTLREAGFKDGAVLAWKVARDGDDDDDEFVVDVPVYEEEEVEN